MADLYNINIISKKEYLLLLRSQRFLSKTRFFLHLINNKPEERLFFSNQKKLAEFFGYFCDTNKGVERFMQEFYKHISVVKQLNEILNTMNGENTMTTQMGPPVSAPVAFASAPTNDQLKEVVIRSN